uniref:Anoctamin n=1 Tax=Heterorhabditis bacteriophora TaxID=37862 RepID=A0A1I7WM14_HETBA
MSRRSPEGIQKWFGPHSPYWGMNWRIISPALAMIIMIFTLMRSKMKIQIGNNVYTFPWWAELFGWFLNIIPISAIPFIFFVNFHQWKREGKTIRDMFNVQSTLRSYERIMTFETSDNKPISHPFSPISKSPLHAPSKVHWCPGLLVTNCTECTIDCSSLPNDLLFILITDSDSASNCGSFQYNFLNSVQSLLLMKKRISQIQGIIMRR